LIGETLGKYEIVEHLGHGGMAEVYKAYQPGLDRYVAIKVLHSFLADEENFLARFQREAKAVAALRHPNIVQVHDFDHDQERNIYYMVMEFIDGPSLKVRLQQLVARGEFMPLDEAVRIVAAVAEALDYAHRQGMVHRDVKPANILFTGDGQAILTDFGIARMINTAGLTASGAMVGTPAYISPEQGMGQAGDERSDIYSLGVVLYQLVTGLLPFDADTSMGVVLKHINEPPPSPRDARPDLPPALEQVMMRALAKEPEKRYQVAAQFAADLRQAMAGQEVRHPLSDTVVSMPAPGRTIPMPPAAPPQVLTPPPSPPPGATTPPPWPTPPPPPKRRGRVWIPILLGLLLLSLLAAATFLTLGGYLGDLGNIGIPAIIGAVPTPDAGATQLAGTIAAAQATGAAATDTPTSTSTPTATSTATPTPTGTPAVTATAVSTCSLSMEVTGDAPVWPVVLVPEQEFTKRWEIRNTGTCTWPLGIELVFASGEELEVVVPPQVTPLPPGETTKVEITLRAPAAYGSYTSVWQLQGGGENPVGEELEITCRVGTTPTPQPTSQPVATPTPEPTTGPYEPLQMYGPWLVSCQGDGGRVEWNAGGGPTTEYHYFWSSVDSTSELPGPYNDFVGFPHAETYFTTSGEGVFWPLPEGCCSGDEGWYRTAEGYEVVWRKVFIRPSDCP